MRADPEKIGAALDDWVKLEVTETSKRYHDLAKFLFSIASASLATIAGLVTLTAQLRLNGLLAGSFALHFITFFVSAAMLMPRVWRVGPSTVLENEIAATIRRAQLLLGCWFALWVGAVALGVAALMT